MKLSSVLLTIITLLNLLFAEHTVNFQFPLDALPVIEQAETSTTEVPHSNDLLPTSALGYQAQQDGVSNLDKISASVVWRLFYRTHYARAPPHTV
jgi:hypothetical protein